MNRQLRVLQIAPSVPFPGVPHAGGRYHLEVDRALLSSGARVVLLVPSEPVMRRDLPRILPGVEGIDPEQGMEGGRIADLLLRASHRLNTLVRRTPLDRVHVPFVLAILLRPRVRALVRTADVIDLQWFEVIPLAPMLRLLGGRRARILGTFHDVMSQRLERHAAICPDPQESRRHRRRARQVRRIEGWLTGMLDASLVLSEKDRDLLVAAGADPSRVRVLAPPMAAADAPAPEHRLAGPPAAPVVLLVGWLARPENVDAVTWMISEIWPLVRARVPSAELHVVGADAPPDLVRACERVPGVVPLGFVEDLEAEYAQAACAVVPLRDGAGVKFKTLEAIIAALPTVATPVGAEGVGTSADFTTVSEDPCELAAGVVRALTDPAERERAAVAAARLRAAHTTEAFRRSISEVYRVTR